MPSSTPPKKKKKQGLPLGVEEDYEAPTGRKTVSSHKGDSGGRSTKRYGYSTITTRPEMQAPTFFASDLDKPAAWSPSARAQLQSDLVAAGLLSKKGFSLGVWDDPTRNAYKKVLSYANRAGITSIDQALGVFLSQPKGGAGGGGPTRAPFVAELPNPDDIRKVAEKIAPTIRGRNLDVAEVDAIIREYNALTTNAQRSAYDAAASGGTVTQAPDLGTFIENKTKALHPDEADTFHKFNLVGDVMAQLGISGTAGTRG